jgi:hypothetical protein
LIWKWELPLKIKIFIWIMLNKLILTWDNLSSRGFFGLVRCALCGSADENIDHIMFQCRFVQEVSKLVDIITKSVFLWNECSTGLFF